MHLPLFCHILDRQEDDAIECIGRNLTVGQQDAKLFYKIVFGKWFLMILIALFLQLAYQVITQAQQVNKEIEMEEKKSEPVIKAWEYLYNQSSKQFRRQMDTALIKATQQRK